MCDLTLWSSQVTYLYHIPLSVFTTKQAIFLVRQHARFGSPEGLCITSFLLVLVDESACYLDSLYISIPHRPSMTTLYKEEPFHHYHWHRSFKIICIALDTIWYVLVCLFFACFTQLACNVSCSAYCYTLCA